MSDDNAHDSPEGDQVECNFKLVVSDSDAGALIGKNGQNKGSLESSTGACIHIAPRGQDRIALISGLKNQVVAGCCAILHVLFRESPECDHALDILIPEHACGRMYGKGSANFRKMQEVSGCTFKKVDLERQEYFADRLFTAEGNLEQVAALCRLVIEDVVSDPRYAYDNLTVNPKLDVCTRCGACKYRPEKPRTACNFGILCTREDCPYGHPSINSPSDKPGLSVVCRNGIACTYPKCPFAHPSPSLTCPVMANSEFYAPADLLGGEGGAGEDGAREEGCEIMPTVEQKKQTVLDLLSQVGGQAGISLIAKRFYESLGGANSHAFRNAILEEHGSFKGFVEELLQDKVEFLGSGWLGQIRLRPTNLTRGSEVTVRAQKHAPVRIDDGQDGCSGASAATALESPALASGEKLVDLRQRLTGKRKGAGDSWTGCEQVSRDGSGGASGGRAGHGSLMGSFDNGDEAGKRLRGGWGCLHPIGSAGASPPRNCSSPSTLSLTSARAGAGQVDGAGGAGAGQVDGAGGAGAGQVDGAGGFVSSLFMHEDSKACEGSAENSKLTADARLPSPLSSTTSSEETRRTPEDGEMRTTAAVVVKAVGGSEARGMDPHLRDLFETHGVAADVAAHFCCALGIKETKDLDVLKPEHIDPDQEKSLHWLRLVPKLHIQNMLKAHQERKECCANGDGDAVAISPAVQRGKLAPATPRAADSSEESSEFEEWYDKDFFKNEEDRQWLMSLNQLDREAILEKRQDRQAIAREAWQMSHQNKKAGQLAAETLTRASQRSRKKKACRDKLEEPGRKGVEGSTGESWIGSEVTADCAAARDVRAGKGDKGHQGSSVDEHRWEMRSRSPAGDRRGGSGVGNLRGSGEVSLERPLSESSAGAVAQHMKHKRSQLTSLAVRPAVGPSMSSWNGALDVVEGDLRRDSWSRGRRRKRGSSERPGGSEEGGVGHASASRSQGRQERKSRRVTGKFRSSEAIGGSSEGLIGGSPDAENMGERSAYQRGEGALRESRRCRSWSRPRGREQEIDRGSELADGRQRSRSRGRRDVARESDRCSRSQSAGDVKHVGGTVGRYDMRRIAGDGVDVSPRKQEELGVYDPHGIFIKDLPSRVSKDDLEKAFRKWSGVLSCSIKHALAGNRILGFVRLQDVEAVKDILAGKVGSFVNLPRTGDELDVSRLERMERRGPIHQSGCHRSGGRDSQGALSNRPPRVEVSPRERQRLGQGERDSGGRRNFAGGGEAERSAGNTEREGARAPVSHHEQVRADGRQRSRSRGRRDVARESDRCSRSQSAGDVKHVGGTVGRYDMRRIAGDGVDVSPRKQEELGVYDPHGIFIKDLPSRVSKDDLEKAFRKWSGVLSCSIKHALAGNRILGFVRLQDAEAVKDILAGKVGSFVNLPRTGDELDVSRLERMERRGPIHQSGCHRSGGRDSQGALSNRPPRVEVSPRERQRLGQGERDSGGRRNVAGGGEAERSAGNTEREGARAPVSHHEQVRADGRQRSRSRGRRDVARESKDERYERGLRTARAPGTSYADSMPVELRGMLDSIASAEDDASGHVQCAAQAASLVNMPSNNFVPGGIFIRDLPDVIMDDDLSKCLQQRATVVKMSRDRSSKRAYVLLDSPEAAHDLIEGLYGDLVIANYSRPIPCHLLLKLKLGTGPHEFRQYVKKFLEQSKSDRSNSPHSVDRATNEGLLPASSPGASTRECALSKPSADREMRAHTSSDQMTTQLARRRGCCSPLAFPTSAPKTCNQLLSSADLDETQLLWEGALGAEAGAKGVPWRRVVVQARLVFGENLDLLLSLENILWRQTEWTLRGPLGDAGDPSAASCSVPEAAAGRLDWALVSEKCRRARRESCLVLCLLELQEADSEWLDADLSTWFYWLELPADAAFSAAVLPRESELGQELLWGCAHPLLACWLH